MSFTDPIADMLTRIRNASSSKHPQVEMPHSKMKAEIARILKKEGYISDASLQLEGGKKKLRIVLKYDRDGVSVIRGVRRVSRSGLRQYVPSAKVPRVLGGLGVAVISTSSGILSDREARKSKVGGEVLCKIW